MLAGLVRSLGDFFFVRVMARWVAGSDAESSVRYCSKIGGNCMINLLGEHYKTAKQALESIAEHKRLIGLISSSGSKASLTLKPSQFGLDAKDVADPEGFCAENLLEVVRLAAKRKIPVWLDMEGSGSTGFTLGFYHGHAASFRMGICLQANLKRTERDLDGLIALSAKAPVKVRLVKGIYLEDPAISVRDPKKLHGRFLKLIRYAFERSPRSFGIAVGSHHPDAIGLALRLQKKHGKKDFGIQVLKGVMPEYYKALRKRGVPLAEYVPYGKDAFAYSMRRAMKNPAFASSILYGILFDAYKKLYG